MFIDYTPEQKKLQSSLQSYLRELITDDVMDEVRDTDGGGPLYMQTMAQLGEDGWLGIGWPKEYGGQDRPAIEQFIFYDEIQRAGFPLPFLTLLSVGPTLMKYGSEEQKKEILPKILAGKCHFAIGYTEPEAGTDLASLKTKAVLDGDHYVVNGQKIFTSQAEYADYIWLAVRTDPDAPKHKGISMLIVDRNAPGVSITPIKTLASHRTNTTYYEDVRVPASMLVAGEGRGWKLITNQLNHERIALVTPGPVKRFVDETIEWAENTTLPDGRRVIDQEWVQVNLAKALTKVEAVRLFSWRQACHIDQERLNPAEASTVKVFGSESFVDIYSLLLEVIGPQGALKRGSAGAFIRGRMEQFYRATLVLTFGGGVNEVQRDIICMAGLGMPRAQR